MNNNTVLCLTAVLIAHICIMSYIGGVQIALLMTHFKAITRKLSIYSLKPSLSRSSVIV